MILKIERYRENQEYWLLDNVRKISVSKGFKYKTQNERDNVGLPDIAFLDLLNCNCVETENSSGSCSNCVDHNEYRVKRIICRLDNEEEYSVMFDTTVYVLNDRGKTIEKIVANYKD